MLPSPSLAALVVTERPDPGDEHAALAARPQPRVDLVEPTGARMYGEDVHDALCETHEEELVIERSFATGLLHQPVGVMEKNEVEV